VLHAGEFGFRARLSKTFQCVRLRDHVTFNVNNFSMAAIFLDIEKTFEATLHPRLLCIAQVVPIAIFG
jgi:hypothetical protein